jgi:hypothetical protein
MQKCDRRFADFLVPYRSQVIVIPNLPAEGWQERDLTSACAENEVWLPRIEAIAPCITTTFVVIRMHHQIPPSLAFQRTSSDANHRYGNVRSCAAFGLLCSASPRCC